MGRMMGEVQGGRERRTRPMISSILGLKYRHENCLSIHICCSILYEILAVEYSVTV